MITIPVKKNHLLSNYISKEEIAFRIDIQIRIMGNKYGSGKHNLSFQCENIANVSSRDGRTAIWGIFGFDIRFPFAAASGCYN